jgi:crotonobetainyl-CoA:carnitine CoA-transferase CaiB-like acyl-CoA transferase
MTDVARPAPLKGRKVLDLSRVLAGPWATMILGDLGADVIKIERPGSGDDTRHWGPPFAGGEAAYYLCANRNKRSLALDIASPQGQAILREIAAEADVVVENFRPGALAKYGLDYASLSAVNPRLVYCSITGYGHSSPEADRAGYDYVVQGEGGLMAVTGPIGGRPMKVGVAVADLFTGNAAAQAILAALIAADRDGQGQHIDMALIDCQLAMLANVGSAALVTGAEPKRWGNAHPTIVPYELFDCADAPIVLAVGNDRQFRALCERVLGRPEWAGDARFAGNADRVANRETLVPLIAEALAAKTADEWLDALEADGIPAGKVRGVHEALVHPTARARGMVREIDHPAIGPLKLVASPLKLSQTPIEWRYPPPLLGEHGDEVLRELGRSDADIAALREAGVLG